MKSKGAYLVYLCSTFSLFFVLFVSFVFFVLKGLRPSLSVFLRVLRGEIELRTNVP
jgi:hypothetical protein